MTESESLTAPTFETLLESVLGPAYRAAYHLTRNEADAEELVQEAALLAYRGFARFQTGTNFRAWFLTILRNRFVSEYRKRQREVPTVNLDDGPDLYLYAKARDAWSAQTDDPAAFLMERIDAQRVADALNDLPLEFREVCTLYFTQDLSYEEIATIADIPLGTVRSRLHRGRKLLQRRLLDLAEEYGIVRAANEGE